MEFNQIRYFTEAAEKMHFALAAEALGVAQPSLSRGIQQLEKELAQYQQEELRQEEN